MHIAVFSNYGCVGIALRLQSEGHDVLLCCNPGDEKNDSVGRYKLVGEGIVPTTDSWAYLLNWAVEHSRRAPTLLVFEASGEGKKADQARQRGLHVIGSGAFADRLEKDRSFGFEVAERAGAVLPPYEEFETVSEAIAYARTLGDTPTYWKTDKYLDADSTQGKDNGEDMAAYLEGIRAEHGDAIPSILQQKIPGVAISTARWWNGRVWTGPFTGDIEHKKAFNDELGPSTGCAFDGVWFYDDDLPPLAKALGWERLAETFVRYEAPPGVYDMNAIVDEEGNAYFLEWTPRFGWDCTPTSFELFRGGVGEFFWGLATGTANGPDVPTDRLAYSIRLGVPPYPWEHWTPPGYGGRDSRKFRPAAITGLDLADPNYFPDQVALIDDRLVTASPDGSVGLALGTGKRLSVIHDTLVEWVKEHKRGITGLTARTDGAKCIAEDAKALNAAGLNVPEGLTK